jgi:hypothetical protein
MLNLAEVCPSYESGSQRSHRLDSMVHCAIHWDRARNDGQNDGFLQTQPSYHLKNGVSEADNTDDDPKKGSHESRTLHG